MSLSDSSYTILQVIGLNSDAFLMLISFIIVCLISLTINLLRDRSI